MPLRPQTDPTSVTPSQWFLNGAGASREAARAVDWNQNPLGPPDQWPTTLKTTLAMMFQARQPMFLWWGPELTQFYNDEYLPSFGEGKHPTAMGQRGRECWTEIWPIIGPQIDDTMMRGVPSLNESALVPIMRNGIVEEVYWNYTYTPVFSETGSVAGTLVICTETTSRVLAERRSLALHSLLTATAGSSEHGELLDRTLKTMATAALDVPCMLICRCEGDNTGEKALRIGGCPGWGQRPRRCSPR